VLFLFHMTDRYPFFLQIAGCAELLLCFGCALLLTN